MKQITKLRIGGIAIASVAALAVGMLPVLATSGTVIGTNISTTGTLSADGNTTLGAYTNNLSDDSASLYADSTNHFIGIGTISPDSILEVVSSTHSNGAGFFKLYNSQLEENIFAVSNKGHVMLNSYEDYSGAGPALSIYQHGVNAGDGLYVEQMGMGGNAGAALELVQDNSDKPGLTTNGQIVSTLSTDAPPFVVSSTTPVANLTASPTTYGVSGSQIPAPHIVTGSADLSGNTVTVTFSNSAVFDAASDYVCTANDVTAPNPVQVDQTSGTSVTFTGTGTDSIKYICVGTDSGT